MCWYNGSWMCGVPAGIMEPPHEPQCRARPRIRHVLRCHRRQQNHQHHLRLRLLWPHACRGRRLQMSRSWQLDRLRSCSSPRTRRAPPSSRPSCTTCTSSWACAGTRTAPRSCIIPRTTPSAPPPAAVTPAKRKPTARTTVGGATAHTSRACAYARPQRAPPALVVSSSADEVLQPIWIEPRLVGMHRPLIACQPAVHGCRKCRCREYQGHCRRGREEQRGIPHGRER